MKIKVVRNIFEANNRIAEENRGFFEKAGVKVVNLMSAPGAGKTTLLEKTISSLRSKMKIGVIEGDIQTSLDAERIDRAGATAVQVNTEGACHLDANMVATALAEIDLASLDLLIIENVGNLVCPAEFNVGEHAKAMILSLAEGDDKPAKYPLMFKTSQVLLINKMDLQPYVSCDAERIERDAKALNPNMRIFRMSCQTGEGLEQWCQWLETLVRG